MDPITAISLAIGAIKLGIEIYQYIHSRPDTPEEVKVKVAAKIESDMVTLQRLEDQRTEWEKRNDYQSP